MFDNNVNFNREWEITERVEVLRESFSDLLSAYERFFSSHGISVFKSDNVAVNMYLLLAAANKSLLLCHSFNEVLFLEGKYLLGKDFLEELVKHG